MVNAEVNRVDLLIEKAWTIRLSDTQRALELSQEAYGLLVNSDDTKGLASGLRNLAICNQILLDFENSLLFCYQALPLYESLKDEKGVALIYSFIGTNFFQLSDYENALMYHLKALKIREQLKSDVDHSSSLLSIANVYATIKEYEKALGYYLESEKLAIGLSDKTVWAKVLNGIGGMHMACGDYEKAIDCFIQSVNIKKELGDIRSTASTLRNMGDCSIELRDFENAQQCLMESKKIAVEFGDRSIEAACLQTFGKLFLVKKMLPEAIDQARRSLGIFTELKSIKEQSNCHKLLADAWFLKGGFELAYTHLNSYFLLKEEVTHLESAKKIENLILVRQIETMKNESEIERLKKVELKTAYRQIEEKNNNILDSIEYAKYIQETLLPNEESIKLSFKESFVFFLPKDIVSGDFYLHYRIGDKVLLAVVDCTGHGVPGAFMSLAGNNILEHIIKTQKVYEPKFVLKELNNAIVEKFKKGDELSSAKNGMDIAFCSIDTTTLQMEYAGAHNPVYLVHSGELTEMKSDRIIIGINGDQEFSQQKIQLQKGDMVYLFSDGFADQKGGGKGLKFYYPPFKQLLMDISAYAVAEQKSQLGLRLAEWKGSEGQTDDVTVIGLRL